jgi:hypothetical protein
MNRLILWLALFGFLKAEATQTNAPGAPPDVSQVIRALEACPDWTNPNVSPDEIIANLIPLAKYDSDVLRAGTQGFVDKCRDANRYNVSNMSKLLILNRILFAVPSREKFGGPFFGGWEGVPYDAHQIDRLWPLSLDGNGKLRLTGKYSGYSGPGFSAVREFDHFLQKYGRRKV